jgi:ABC-type multidrug transport system ATPase subunit
VRATQPQPIASLEALETSPRGFASKPPLMLASGITKRWGRRHAPILDAVDLELPRGSIVALQGVNGAGKTTLLRILAGLFLPNAGTVTLDGLDPVHDRRAYQSRLGFVAAGHGGLYARMTVKDQLDFWARLALLTPRKRRTAVIMALGRFDLAQIASSRVDRLSMGQRQRVRLAGAFLHAPDVVLLDEPRNSLDDAGVELLFNVLREFRRTGGSAVWCAPTVHEPDLDLDSRHELVGGRLVLL